MRENAVTEATFAAADMLFLLMPPLFLLIPFTSEDAQQQRREISTIHAVLWRRQKDGAVKC